VPEAGILLNALHAGHFLMAGLRDIDNIFLQAVQ
jgi:hypothetical protein